VSKRRLAVRGREVLAVDDRGRVPFPLGTVFEVLPEQGPALDEGKPAQVLVAGVEEVECIEARCSAARAAGSVSSRVGDGDVG